LIIAHSLSTPFAINNFDKLYYYGSEIVGLTTVGSVGDLQLDFGISGEVGVFYDLKLEYKLDGSPDWQQAKNITGTMQDTRIESRMGVRSANKQ
jgi:hypothetical protein